MYSTKMLMAAILIGSLTISSASQTYTWNINIRSTCEQRDTQTGACLSWVSNGNIKRGDCFIGNTFIQVRETKKIKSIPFSELKVGDFVFGRNSQGHDDFVEVISWLHRDPRGHGVAIRLETETGQVLYVTEEHLIWANNGFIEARDLMIGDILKTVHGYQTKLISKKTSLVEGMYLPLLNGDGTVYVDDILAHTLTHVTQYGLPPKAAWMVTKQMAQLTSDGSNVPEEEEYYNPFVRFVSWAFGYDDRQHQVIQMRYMVIDDPETGEKTLQIKELEILNHDLTKINRESLIRKIMEGLQKHQAYRGKDDEFDQENLITSRKIRSLDQPEDSQEDDQSLDDHFIQDGQIFQGEALRSSSSYGKKNTYDDDDDDDEDQKEEDDVAQMIVYTLLTHWSHTIFNKIVIDENYTPPTPKPETTTFDWGF